VIRSVVSAALVAAALAQGTGTDFVELDVVALDRHGLPVTNLSASDFEVRDGGNRVRILTFSRIAARGTGVDEERSVVVLMDDIGVPISGTTPMRLIAPVLLSPTRPADEIAVVRLSRPRDEAFGDVESARDRIDSYRGGAVPFSTRDTPEAVLGVIARIATELEPIEHRRKALICLGLPAVCDVRPPDAGSTVSVQKAWTAAIMATARTNTSVYLVDPTGLTARSGPSGIGLVRLTGGDVFANSNDFSAAAARIWSEASQYYLLGYSVASSARQIHEVDVRPTRRDIHVRARRMR
jgi:VWFA-related protein